jgi:tetratricopeptide (TPR) repeat protein
MLSRFRQILLVQRWHPGKCLLLLTLFFLLAIGIGLATCHQLGQSRLRAAREAMDRRALNQARTDLGFCLAVWPRDADSYLLAARIARLEHHEEEAREHLRMASRLNGDWEALQLERLLLKAQQGQLDQIEEGYLQERILAADSQAPFILEALSQGHNRNQRLSDAHMCLEAWRRLQPDQPEPLVQRGLSHLRLYHHAEAVADFRAALALDPQHFRAALLLADVLLQLGRPGEAVEYFQDLYERQPDDKTVVLGLARCRLQLGETESARDLIERLVAQHPEEMVALRERGQLAYRLGEFAEAERWLRQAVAREPLDKESQYSLGLCLQKRGQAPEAAACFARADLIDRAVNRLKDLYRQIITLPHDPVPRYQTGLVFLAIGLSEEAVRWFASALQEAPNHSPTHRVLADFYEKARQPERAARHRQQAGQPATASGVTSASEDRLPQHVRP